MDSNNSKVPQESLFNKESHWGEQYILSFSIANRYEQLINLQDRLENDTTLMTQGESNISEIPNCDHQTKVQHQSRERIQQIDKKNKEDFQIYHNPNLT